MNIRVTQVWPLMYRAVDDSTYDGTPDSRWNQVGLGLTPEAAIADLKEQLEST